MFTKFRKALANFIYPHPHTDSSILDAQMKYIEMLQDTIGNMNGMIGELIKPVIETNKVLQAELKIMREIHS